MKIKLDCMDQVRNNIVRTIKALEDSLHSSEIPKNISQDISNCVPPSCLRLLGGNSQEKILTLNIPLDLRGEDGSLVGRLGQLYE